MYKIKLRSTPNKTYELSYGWYAYAGNRKTLGWYLRDLDNNHIRPFCSIDADDVFMWSSSSCHDWNKENFHDMVKHIDRFE